MVYFFFFLVDWRANLRQLILVLILVIDIDIWWLLITKFMPQIATPYCLGWNLDFGCHKKKKKKIKGA